ncbi:ABC transporter permease [Ilumatobacter coccineus]|uniref:Oligopeptide ABC transporter permease protein n=1 Tax=Ilumatobacter coccineus (strain NBRC 103263 / KCTC 29153 / YM16-304) TaxID=1313172 RepID=A0A6C7E939_ILUCY|nr:ABC transporter permease [Ilumatobacter coccineus]BAN02981.1 oligopeptide ABC transporter permease protein [Ilumatobacter coccineus YM16-304]
MSDQIDRPVDAPTVEVANDVETTTPMFLGLRRFARRFYQQKPAVVAAIFLILIIGSAVFAPLLATHDPYLQDLSSYLQSPSKSNWFGTDDLGRDLYSRMLFAGRVSLLAALQSVVVALVLGVIPGIVAGYSGGWIDAIIMRITDAIMAFPPLILAISIVAVLGPGLRNAMFAIGIIFAPRFLRLGRGATLAVRQETYIEAARSIGTPRRTIIRRHVLPNVAAPLIVQASLLMGVAMLAEAALSFIALGVQAPEASWGSLLQRGFRLTQSAPWLTIFPGIPIALTVLSLNVLGDGLRDSLGKEVRKS